MTQPQIIFQRIREAQKKRKHLRSIYRDLKDHHNEYKTVAENIRRLRERKKEIEVSLQQEMGKDYEKLEDLNADIKADAELLSDASITEYTSGKTVAVKDEFENEYEPLFSVRFVKKA